MRDNPVSRGKEWLEELLTLTGTSTKVIAQEDKNIIERNGHSSIEGYWLTIDETKLTPEEIEIYIGTDGKVLDAIQYLANSVLNINQLPEEQASYTVELNSYRIGKQEQIFSVAEDAADRVRSSGEEVEIRSLSSADRRQIHTYLERYSDLETFSRGREPHRHLVVRPAEQI
ncbi:MAG: R3H domain-containing nucleic acid-binding protein [Cyanobacteria bacterium P01_A01_bin.84]